VHRNTSRAAALAATATAVVVGLAAPAAADTTVSPATAEQGSGVNLTFTVTNDSPSTAITKVTLTLPTDNPIAEVYPLSVPDWAPQLTDRKLDPPVAGIHGSLLSEATATVTWTAMPGKAIQPGGSADLMVAMGPLPQADRVAFTVRPTYADGSAGPGETRVAMMLTPAPAGAGAHGGGAARGTPHGGAATGQVPHSGAAVVDTADDGPGFWSVAGWIVAALFAGLGAVATLRTRRQRRETAPADEPGCGGGNGADDRDGAGDDDRDGDGTREPAVTGPRVTSWSYRDGP
jgi:uncharacterized protein YcnI